MKNHKANGVMWTILLISFIMLVSGNSSNNPKNISNEVVNNTIQYVNTNKTISEPTYERSNTEEIHTEESTASATQPEPVEEPQVQNSYTVYITNTGKKYHTAYCSYLRQSKIAIDKSDAVARGYTPCSRCRP